MSEAEDLVREPDEWTKPPLTFEESEAIARLGDIANCFEKAIVASGAAKDADVAEFNFYIRGAQRVIMQNAVSRYYPETYRMLGKVGPPDRTIPVG